MAQSADRGRRSLRAQDALDWLSARSVSVPDDAPRDINLVTDELIGSGGRIARLWHTATRYDIGFVDAKALVMVQIEGTVSIASETWPQRAVVKAGEVILLSKGAAPFNVESSVPVARYEIELELSLIAPQIQQLLATGRTIAPAPAFLNAVIAAANAVLNNPVDPDGVAFASFVTGMQHLVAGLIQDEIADDLPFLRTPRVQIYEEAMRVISARAPEMDFSIGILAAGMRVSERSLRYAFASVGTTARDALTAERVRIAKSYLASDERGPRPSVSAVATASGFSDIRAMRRAFTKLGEDLPLKADGPE